MNNNNERVNSVEGIKVGDRVWSLDQGWGEVSSIDYSDTSYPIKVETKVGTKMSYTIDGYHFVQDKVPSLFFDEVSLYIPKRPKKIPKRGQPILVKGYGMDCNIARVFYCLDAEGRAVTFASKGENGEYEAISWDSWDSWEEFDF